AAAVGAVVELVAPRPERADTLERSQSAEVPVAVPALRLDALPLLLGDGDLIFLAAGAADVAIPVLQNREMTDRKRHRQPGATRTGMASAWDYCTRLGRSASPPKKKRSHHGIHGIHGKKTERKKRVREGKKREEA